MEAMKRLLLESAARLFADAPEDEVQEAIAAGVFPAAMWQAIEDNGLPSAAVPEEHGGSGVALKDALAPLRLAGAFGVSLPLAETMLARWLLTQVGLEVPSGPLALVLGEAGQSIAAVERSDGLALVGSAWVSWPADAASWVVVAEAPGGDVVALFDRPAEARDSQASNLAGEPRVFWDLCTQTVPASDWRDLSAIDGVDRFAILRLAAAARSQMIAGAMERVLDLSIDYAQGREQFGRAIARFQAVQHLIAQLAAEVAAVGVAADAACAGLFLPVERLRVAAAKARASEAVSPVTRIAHQVHGAIGFTREHALQVFTRRLWVWRDDYGNESFWHEYLGQRALNAGGDELWSLVSETESEVAQRS